MSMPVCGAPTPSSGTPKPCVIGPCTGQIQPWEAGMGVGGGVGVGVGVGVGAGVAVSAEALAESVGAEPAVAGAAGDGSAGAGGAGGLPPTIRIVCPSRIWLASARPLAASESTALG